MGTDRTHEADLTPVQECLDLIAELVPILKSSRPGRYRKAILDAGYQIQRAPTALYNLPNTTSGSGIYYRDGEILIAYYLKNPRFLEVPDLSMDQPVGDIVVVLGQSIAIFRTVAIIKEWAPRPPDTGSDGVYDDREGLSIY